MQQLKYLLYQNIKRILLCFIYIMGTYQFFQMYILNNDTYNNIQSYNLHFIYFFSIYFLAYFSLFLFQNYFDLNKKFHVDIIHTPPKAERIIDIIKHKKK